MKKIFLSGLSAHMAVVLMTTATFLSVSAPEAKAQSVASARTSVASSPEKGGYPFINANFTRRADLAWTHFKETIGNPLSAWVQSGPTRDVTGTVFYPFSGPDLVTLAHMYPQADRYVMVALQPAGRPADPKAMSAAHAQAFEQKFLNEWIKFSQLGFFRTLDLNADLQDRNTAIGVATIIKTFAVSMGFDVIDVIPIAFDRQSNTFEPASSDRWQSVRFLLRKDGRSVTVDYISLDLSDGSLTEQPELVSWMAREASNPVLIKAASHLLQESYFSVLREILIDHATMIVQDETGLEYADLTRVGPVDLYGGFLQPHPLFNPNKQRSLARAYVERAATVRDLPFAFSYNKDIDRNCLQIAVRAQ
jgi:hypothetical protein